MENKVKKETSKETSVVRILVNPRTKEYKDISASRILVNGTPLSEFIDKLLVLENDFNVSIKILKAQVNTLKNVVQKTQILSNGQIANIQNTIKDLGGKL